MMDENVRAFSGFTFLYTSEQKNVDFAESSCVLLNEQRKLILQIKT